MTFKPQHFPEHLYFVTGSLLGWRPLFTRPAYAMIVLNSLDWHRKQGRFQLYVYVIMPTHFHVITKPAENQTISANLQSLGSFTAHAILQQLRADNLADELAFFAAEREPDRSEQHQIWQPMQAKNIYTPAFLRKKLEYIHNNPVAKKWDLTERRDEYAYSSARFYDRGIEPIIAVDDVRQWLIE
jgi:REP element-mobilizing transposase RayT